MNRVLLILDRAANQRLLAAVLGEFYTVATPAGPDPFACHFDLCLLDGPALDRLQHQAEARRARVHPIFLPFLLVSPNKTLGLATRHLWRIVDDVLVTPVEKTELLARVRSLLNTRQLSLDLAAAREQAEAADRIKSAFLATMSHELRTPLNSIIGFTGILAQGLAGPLNPEQQKQLEMVRGSARHLLALINDVLDISRIEAGQLAIIPEPFDLPASLNKVLSLIAPLAAQKGLRLQSRISPLLRTWVADPRRFEQILINLLNNAVKFTDRGAVTLTARLTTTHATPSNRLLRIAVADTGTGIKPQDLARLFQPFHQLDTGLTRTREGTGLGLAISSRLAGLLGGRITVRSQWGKGSVFILSLPARSETAVESPPPLATPEVLQ